MDNRGRVRSILQKIRHKEIPLDQHGQPVDSAICQSRIAQRAIDELIGIAKGVLADGKVVEEEAEFIVQWITANAHAADVWPINIIFNRLDDMLCDDILDEAEKVELMELLHEFTGGCSMEKYENMTTALPLTSPPPDIRFAGREFCFTGKFVFGTRNQCIEAVKMKDGFFNPNPRENTDYIIVGLIGSRDWLHSTHGIKIESAMKMRESGHHIAIVSEQHWVNFL